MPYLKIKNYSVSAFDGLLAISPSPFPAAELGGSVSEVFSSIEPLIPRGRAITEFGWLGFVVVELDAAQRLEHQDAVEQAGTARFTLGASVDINQAAATPINWTAVFFDDLLYFDTGAAIKTILEAGTYRIIASITSVQSGAQDINVFVRLYINGAAQIRSRSAAAGTTSVDAITHTLTWEGPLAIGDQLTLQGTGLTSNAPSLDTSPDAGLWLIERID